MLDALKKKIYYERALFYAVLPVLYLVLDGLLYIATNAMQLYLEWDGLLWQCLRALALTMFVLAPLCFIFSSIGCITHAVKKLRAGEAVRKNAALIVIAVVTIALSAVWFWWYWYGRT